MRLDQFLRASRLVLRRKIAQELCELGAVSVNGTPARASRAVRVGDEVSVRRWDDQLLTVRVTHLPAARQTSKQEAATLYEILTDERSSAVGKDFIP
jgi:ribosomal 50S subunit-recycling heat shock protein